MPELVIWARIWSARALSRSLMDTAPPSSLLGSGSGSWVGAAELPGSVAWAGGWLGSSWEGEGLGSASPAVTVTVMVTEDSFPLPSRAV